MKNSYITSVIVGGQEKIRQFARTGGEEAVQGITELLATMDLNALKEKTRLASFGTEGYFRALEESVENDYFDTLPILQKREEQLAAFAGQQITEEHRIFKQKRMPFSDSKIGYRVLEAVVAAEDEDIVLVDGGEMAEAAEFTFTVNLDDGTLAYRKAGALLGVYDLARSGEL